MLRPETLIGLPGLERLDGHGLSDREGALATELDEMAVRPDAGLLEVADLGLRELPLGDGVERELDRVVPVDVGGLHLDDGTRPGLDHGDGRHHPGVGVEDLAHSELLAEDALHLRA